MIGFHCTDRKNAGSIVRWGLIPRDPAKHNYPHHEGVNAQIEAVWCWLEYSDAIEWISPPYDHQRIVEVNLEGLEFEADPYYNYIRRDGADEDDVLLSAVRCFDRITPDRITLSPRVRFV